MGLHVSSCAGGGGFLGVMDTTGAENGASWSTLREPVRRKAGGNRNTILAGARAAVQPHVRWVAPRAETIDVVGEGRARGQTQTWRRRWNAQETAEESAVVELPRTQTQTQTLGNQIRLRHPSCTPEANARCTIGRQTSLTTAVWRSGCKDFSPPKTLASRPASALANRSRFLYLVRNSVGLRLPLTEGALQLTEWRPLKISAATA